MKNKLSLIISSIVSGWCLSIAAYANVDSHKIYFGADVLYSSTKMQKNFGGNVFAQEMVPGVNLFLGHMFNENFGVEVGFELDKTTNQTAYISEQDTICGVPPNNPLQIYSVHHSKFNQNHSYLGIIAKTNISDKNLISVLIGGSLSHVLAKNNLLGNQLVSVGFEPDHMTYTFKKTKLIPMVRIAFEHQFNKNYNIRFLATWKKMSKMIISSSEINSGYLGTIKLKNTITLGIGFSYLLF